MSVTIKGPDGVSYQELFYSTNLQAVFLSGSIPSSAVEVQVDFNDSGYNSYQGLVRWGDGTWTFPDPSYEPDGIALSVGVNSFKIRAILPNGSVTPPATASIRFLDNSGAVANSPTSVSVEQNNNSVSINVEPPDDPNGYLRGINFYASTFPGGGSSGYFRINVNTVSTSSTIQKTSQFANSQFDVTVKADANGNHVADPMYFRVAGSQEDSDEVLLQSDFSEKYEIPESAVSIRYVSQLEEIRTVEVFSFDHNRSFGPTSVVPTVGVSEFRSLSNTEPLYYVATAVFYDPIQKLEYESAFSAEVVAHPATVTRLLGSIGTASRQDILQQFVTAIFRSNPQVKVEVGSVLRDTVIDPFTSESEKLRFILDFYNRARTPALLLQIDDPDGSGTSVPVSQSTYKSGLKSALYFDTDSQVQDLIDSAFESYASNFGVTRKAGVSARGEVTFFTSTRPQTTVSIPIGTQVSGGGQTFSVTQNVSIPVGQLASYYDPVSGFYKVNAPIRSVEVGTQTNLGAGQINKILSNVGSKIRVTNSASTFGGQEGESNLSLTTRVQNRLSSVDSGTKQGYQQSAANTPGVIKSGVVAAGDPLMQRDLDQTGTHRGGKVDVWVQGTNLTTVTDSFAFTFEIKSDVQFEVLDTASLTFRAIDSDLSEFDPIIEMLDNSVIGYEFVNASTGQAFDLQGVKIVSYNTIELDTSLVQPSVDLTDVVLGSYRKRTGTDFVFVRQPVFGVTSLEGAVSGDIPSSAYTLVHPNAPLSYGRSILAGDFLSVVGYTDDSGNSVPSGDTNSVTDEQHVLVGQYPEFLDSLGTNFLTIVVKSSDGLTTYAGPLDPGGAPDYQITLGTQTTAVSITRTDSSSIPSGAIVLVSYEHDENFTVTYTTNLIVKTTQDSIDQTKHATADVLVKEAVPIPIDVEATILLSPGVDTGVADTSLRTNLNNFFGQLRLGDPVRQSDIINVIEGTSGVSYVVVPLTKMVRQEGSTVVREQLSTDTAAESTLLTGLVASASSVFILNQEFSAATVDGGGQEGDFKAVFQDDLELELLPSSSTLQSLALGPGYAFIIGEKGMSIPGFSDDATLEAEGYTTESAKSSRRKEITANRAVVSVAVGDSPVNHEYSVTYIVGNDTGSKNIDPGGAEFCQVGTLTLTYDEDS
jgi:hypothetical protein